MKFVLSILLLAFAGCSTPLVNPQTGAVDVQYNYFSDSGGVCGLYEGAPNAIQTAMPAPAVFTPSNPTQYSAILKICDGTHDLVLTGVVASEGAEDSLNFNNAVSNVSIAGDFGAGGTGLRVITVKGGCQNITIAGTLHGHGTTTDIDLGNWSDQSYQTSAHIDLTGLHEADGSKIRVIVAKATDVKLNSDQVVDQVASDAETAYWQLKYDAREELGIALGQTGPSWLP